LCLLLLFLAGSETAGFISPSTSSVSAVTEPLPSYVSNVRLSEIDCRPSPLNVTVGLWEPPESFGSHLLLLLYDISEGLYWHRTESPVSTFRMVSCSMSFLSAPVETPLALLLEPPAQAFENVLGELIEVHLRRCGGGGTRRNTGCRSTTRR